MSGGLAAQPRHRPAVDEVVAGGHFGNDEPGAQCRGQTAERRIGDARHRREKTRLASVISPIFKALG